MLQFVCCFADLVSPCPSVLSLRRFRVVARSLSAFLLVQIPAESQVRLKAGSEPRLSQKAQQVSRAHLWLLDMLSQHARLAFGVNFIRVKD